MVSQLPVDQNSSLRKMMEEKRAIDAQTSCKKDSIPKGERRGYQSLHMKLLHKHAMTQRPLLEENGPVKFSQMNNQGKSKLAVLSAIKY